MDKLETGSICWVDLTVENAGHLRDFYSRVVGWKPQDVPMGDYSDYNMCTPDTGQASAGVCHARGQNAGLPAKWMVYLIVEDLDESIRACTEMEGKVILGPRSMGESSRYCVIEDPAGAVVGLFQQ